jgi:hypothetical protein
MRNKRITSKEAFEMLERIALAGDRCPTAGTDGLTSQLTSDLARRGDLRIDVYAKNYRVITILTGPNAGRHTALPANPKLKPYLTVEKERPAPSHPGIAP